MNYKHLLANEVPSWANLTAQIAANRAARVLKLPEPRIQWVKWVRPGLREQSAGWVNKDIENTIFLTIDWAQIYGVKQLRGLVYHESRHLWQVQNFYLTTLDERRKAENDANKFVFDQLGILMKLHMWWDGDEYD